jgi:hypothetical protein
MCLSYNCWFRHEYEPRANWRQLFALMYFQVPRYHDGLEDQVIDDYDAITRDDSPPEYHPVTSREVWMQPLRFYPFTKAENVEGSKFVYVILCSTFTMSD